MRFEKEREKGPLKTIKNIPYKEVSNPKIDKFMQYYFKNYKGLNNKLKDN